MFSKRTKIYFRSFLITAIFLFLFSVTNSVFAQNYQLLEDIPTTGSGEGVSGSVSDPRVYMDAAFKYLVGFAVALAILMVAVGGVQYTLTWANEGMKNEGRNRIENAVIGVVLVMTSYLILYTINPKIVSFELSDIGGACKGGAYSSSGGSGGSSSSGGGTYQGAGSAVLSGEKKPGESSSEAILRNAQYAADPAHPLQTCSVPGTEGGRLACAYAVNEIVEEALGKPAGGGLSAPAMYSELKKQSDRFDEIPDISSAKPGDIIITPDRHVGICETAGCGVIISNSTSGRQVKRNFNATSWRKTYGDDIHFFRAK